MAVAASPSISKFDDDDDFWRLARKMARTRIRILIRDTKPIYDALRIEWNRMESNGSTPKSRNKGTCYPLDDGVQRWVQEQSRNILRFLDASRRKLLHPCRVSLMRNVSKSVGGTTSRPVDALDDHVEAIQAAPAQLRRLRLHRAFESCRETPTDSSITGLSKISLTR